MTEKHRVFALEGLDGTGKTTAGKILAEQTEATYYYWMDKNRLKHFRKLLDNAPVHLRFLYYTAAAIDTYFQAESLREDADVFVDRTMLSTIAYHKALGVSDAWISVIPQATINQIDTLIYFTASEETRLQRMSDRHSSGAQHMTEADKKSLLIGRSVDKEFRAIIPERTLIVDTDNKQPQEIVDFVKGNIYG